MFKRLADMVADYERYRALIIELKLKSSMLISACSGASYDISQNRKTKCHEAAYAYYKSDDNLHNPSGYGMQIDASYDEIIYHHACASCTEARRIKKNELAEAKKQFGITKRKISSAGKILLN